MKKIRNRQASCESRKSGMSAFLTDKHIWSWSGNKIKQIRGKGKKIKCNYKAIERGKEKISVNIILYFQSAFFRDFRLMLMIYINCVI